MEGLLLFKSSQDFAWHAATLEGMATVSIIEAWAAGNGLVRLLSNISRVVTHTLRSKTLLAGRGSHGSKPLRN